MSMFRLKKCSACKKVILLTTSMYELNFGTVLQVFALSHQIAPTWFRLSRLKGVVWREHGSGSLHFVTDGFSSFGYVFLTIISLSLYLSLSTRCFPAKGAACIYTEHVWSPGEASTRRPVKVNQTGGLC